jgi:citrate lyase subunit beta / citryl-CoA lyase
VIASEIVRRSILWLSATDSDAISGSWRHGADAIVIDLIPERGTVAREHARHTLRESILLAARGGAEVFVAIDPDVASADIDAAAHSGLTGVAIHWPDTDVQVAEVAEDLTAVERRHGLPSCSLQIVLLVGTARGVWNIRDLIAASDRVTSAILDGSALCRDLGVVARDDFDPLQFAAGRLVIECTAAGVLPAGMSHPLSILPRLLPPGEIERYAQRGRNTGFKGAVCPDPSWVEPCNAAFTPTIEQIEYYREVRRVFAEGIANHRAAVPLGPQMVDVPVDERAKKQIDLWERCMRRDADKAAAMAAN